MSFQGFYHTQLPTTLSRNLNEVRTKAIRLYRASLRSIPFIIKNYELELNQVDMKNRIRSDFIRHSYVTSTGIADRLLFNGEVELKEALLIWKQKSHIEKYFILENKPLKYTGQTVVANIDNAEPERVLADYQNVQYKDL